MNTGRADRIMSLDKMASIAYPSGRLTSGGLYFFREGWNPSGSRFVAFIKDPANNLFEAYSMTPMVRTFGISIATQAIIPGAMTITS